MGGAGLAGGGAGLLGGWLCVPIFGGGAGLAGGGLGGGTDSIGGTMVMSSNSSNESCDS